MGFPFRKSRIFSGETRANRKENKIDRFMAEHAEKTRPAYIQVPKMMDDIEKFGEAEKILNQQGILPPKNPHPTDRMQCAPTWHSVVDAVDRGVALAESMGEATGRSNEETAADAGFFGIMYGAGQFVKDAWNIQDCMDNQDAKYDRELDDYVKKIRNVADNMDSTKMVTEKVEISNPLHPKYQKPSMTPGWNSQPNNGGRDWNFTFNTNGSHHSGGVKWRF
jgi:hypothetical protein